MKKIGNSAFMDKLPRYTLMSLMFGFIMTFVSRTIYSSALGLEIYTTRMFSPQTAGVFAVSVLAVLFLIYAFTAQHGENQNGKIATFIQTAINSPLTVILLGILCFRLWYYSNFHSYTIWYDSATYTDFTENLLLGEVNVFRTPVYPWFIKLMRLLCIADLETATAFNCIVIGQGVVSFIGVILMYLIGKKMFKNRFVTYTLTIVYGISPAVMSWDLNVLTESLSIFATVLSIYLIMCVIEHPTYLRAALLGLFVIVMIMLRPTFVYMFAIIGAFFLAKLILSKQSRKQALCGIVALAISGALMLGYCGLNKRDNDCASVSSVGTTINQMYMLIENDIYKNSNYPEITAYIQTGLDVAGEINYVTDIIEPMNEQFSNSELSAYVKDCISKYKGVFMRYTANKFVQTLTSDVAIQYASIPEENEMFACVDNALMMLLFPLNYAACYAIVAAAVLLAIYEFIKNRVVLWQPIGLAALIFTHMFVSVYASMAEYERLATMIIPSVYLLAFWFVDLLAANVKKSELRNGIVSRGERVLQKSRDEQISEQTGEQTDEQI